MVRSQTALVEDFMPMVAGRNYVKYQDGAMPVAAPYEVPKAIFDLGLAVIEFAHEIGGGP